MYAFQQRLLNITKTLKLGIDARCHHEQQEQQHTDNADCYNIATELNNIGVSLYEYDERFIASELYQDANKLLLTTFLCDDREHSSTPHDIYKKLVQKIVCAKEKLHYITELPRQTRTNNGTLDFFHATHSELSDSNQSPRCIFDAFRITTAATEDKIKWGSAISFFNLGLIFHKDGMLDDALLHYKKVVELAPFHFYKPLLFSAVFNNMGQIFFLRGCHDKAMDNFNEALRINQLTTCCVMNEGEMTKANQYKRTLLNNMARIHFVQYEYDDALSKCLDALSLQKTALKNEHIDITITLFNVGLIQYRRGDAKECIRMFKLFLDRTIYNLNVENNEDVFSARENTIYLGISLNYVGQAYQRYGMVHDALMCYQEALNRGAAHIQTHKIFAVIAYNIGMIIYKQGDYDKALKFFNQSIQLRKLLLGKNHPDIAAVLYGIGVIQVETGRVNEALETFSECCSLQMLVFGDDHHGVSESLFQIGSIYFGIGEYRKAMNILQQSVQITKKVLSGNLLNFTMALCMIGEIHHFRGEVEKALSVYKEALYIVHTDNNSEGISRSTILSTIGNIYLESGEIERAVSSFSEAARVLQTISSNGNGASHTIVESVYHSIVQKQACAASAA